MRTRIVIQYICVASFMFAECLWSAEAQQYDIVQIFSPIPQATGSWVTVSPSYLNTQGQVAGTFENNIPGSPPVISGSVTGPLGSGITNLGPVNPVGISDQGMVIVRDPSTVNVFAIDGPNYQNRRALPAICGGGVNSIGQVTCGIMRAGTVSSAGLTGPGASGLTDLGTLPGDTTAYGTTISNSGQVAGVSASQASGSHAFISSPNGQTPLKNITTLCGGKFFVPAGINVRGTVVGSYGTNDTNVRVVGVVADVDYAGETCNLRTYVNVVPTGINDSDAVVGTFYPNGPNGASSAFVATSSDAMNIIDLNSTNCPTSRC